MIRWSSNILKIIQEIAKLKTCSKSVQISANLYIKQGFTFHPLQYSCYLTSDVFVWNGTYEIYLEVIFFLKNVKDDHIGCCNIDVKLV